MSIPQWKKHRTGYSIQFAKTVVYLQTPSRLTGWTVHSPNILEHTEVGSLGIPAVEAQKIAIRIFSSSFDAMVDSMMSLAMDKSA